MVTEFDVQLYLVSQQDTWFFDHECELAADNINEMLHLINHYRSESDTLEQLEEAVRRTLFDWIEEPALIDLEFEEMDDYVKSVLKAVREQEEDWNE
ncbi:hypothetical protein LG288_05755 [Idiomarina seosinensis]|uniref:hypothetical protein n=1 Tax=Idiomarina seosinensis TaxID=281739 RepID=UPI00384FF65C